MVLHTPPTVDIGTDRVVQLPNSVALEANITLGANPSATLVLGWTLESGPAPVAWGGTYPDTIVHFTTPGTYVVRLTAFDGHTHVYDEVTIQVQPAPPVNNPTSLSRGNTKTGSRR
jgi:hypothetical protein